MLSNLIYPLSLLMGFFSHLDNLILWSILIFSAGLNIYLFNQNKKLKSQLKSRLPISHEQNPVSSVPKLQQQSANDSQVHQHGNRPFGNSLEKEQELAETEDKKSTLSALEAELDETIWLDDHDNNIDIDITYEPVQSVQKSKKHLLQNVLQSLTGWHKSLVPFLVQNIGWFIGILCFISGSIFFISYTEGFTKSVTIFFTILSYTLLLAWGGYRLKDKVSHAAISGNVLMATSFLLVPLNFSAAAQLIANSTGSSQYSVAIVATIIALVTLFYISKIISGVFNRQLLSYFSATFFSLSAIQLIVPMLHNNQSMALLLVLQTIIITLLLMALIYYLPALLKQIFVDRKFLLLFTIGSLIYSALVSTIHITLASPMTIALSYYAPILMLISAALFYIDGQLHEYKIRVSLLSWFSFISYAVSFAAIFLSLDSESSRTLTMLLGSLLYARLMWVYRTLIPLYLVIILLSFLHYDVILSELLTSETGIKRTIAYQYYYLASLPLLGLFSVALFFLRKTEMQRASRFQITHHLFHFIMLSSILLAVFSQWFIADGSIALSNNIVTILASYYLLKSNLIKANELLGKRTSSGYYYLLLFLPVILILLSPNDLIAIDIKLALLTFIALSYSLNSHFQFMTLGSSNEKAKQFDQEILVNTSLLISLLLLVLVGIGFSLSIKTGILLFIIALNSLFLSLTLYNRFLFYVFILIASLSVLIFKLYLSSSPSTGLLTISFTLILFYFINWLDRKRMDEIEALKSETIHQYSPEKILWIYPCHDFSVKLATDKMEEIKNV